MGAPDVTAAETFTTGSVAGTAALGRRLAQRLARGDCVALVGPLGAGKTALVRGIAAGLGIADERLVASPTYVLVHEYPTTPTLYHVDLYRTSSPAAELADLALEEMLADGVAVIEWADRAAGARPRPRWEVVIQITGERRRRFTVRRIE
jgi:tRNA threonylcarbamoyladenosine biosynthesis protein TsaE